MNLRRIRIISLVGLVAVITCLLCDDQSVRYTAAALVAAGAVPWWRVITREFIAKGISYAAEFIRGRPEPS